MHQRFSMASLYYFPPQYFAQCSFLWIPHCSSVAVKFPLRTCSVASSASSMMSSLTSRLRLVPILSVLNFSPTPCCRSVILESIPLSCEFHQSLYGYLLIEWKHLALGHISRYTSESLRVRSTLPHKNSGFLRKLLKLRLHERINTWLLRHISHIMPHVIFKPLETPLIHQPSHLTQPRHRRRWIYSLPLELVTIRATSFFDMALHCVETARA